MKFSAKVALSIIISLALAGCVTSHYKNDKGCECTRRYFTVLGIPTHSCTDVCQPVAPEAKAAGEELKVASLAPSPSLRQSTPAKTIEQNIKTTTQALGRR
jgi:hypothetical protein